MAEKTNSCQFITQENYSRLAETYCSLFDHYMKRNISEMREYMRLIWIIMIDVPSLFEMRSSKHFIRTFLSIYHSQIKAFFKQKFFELKRKNEFDLHVRQVVEQKMDTQRKKSPSSSLDYCTN